MSEQAGREMDARVAEHVMKTEKYWSVLFSCSHYGNFYTLEKAEACVAKIQGEFKAYIVPYYDEPPYSSSIEAAWEVVERLGAHHFDIGKGSEVQGWQVYIQNECPLGNIEDVDRQRHGWHYAVADTAPLAICLAALKAVGAEGEGEHERS